MRSLPLWRLEEETGRQVLTLTGAVDHGPAATTEALYEALTVAGHRAERLAPEEVAERWPGLRADTGAVFHPEAGRLHADEAVTAFQQAARAHGAEVRHCVRVTGLSVLGDDEVRVITDTEEELHADAMDTVLDRVLHGEVVEAFVAAERGCEAEKGQVVARVSLVSVIESSVAGEPGHGPLDDPSVAPQPFTGLDSLRAMRTPMCLPHNHFRR